MQRTADFLDAIRVRYGLTSDYQLAKRLGVTHGAISHYRAGRSQLDDAMAIRVAGLLDLDPGYVVSCAHAERAKDDETRAMWTQLAKRAAVGVLAAFGLTTAPAPPASAAGVAADSVYYVKSRRRKDPAPPESPLEALTRAVSRFTTLAL